MELTKPLSDSAPAAAPKTVNDVSAPQAAPSPAPVEKPAELAVHEPAPSPDDEGAPTEPAKAAKPPKAAKTKSPKTHAGTGAAIFAAVIIILGLGAMFTYAYLRANNIALF